MDSAGRNGQPDQIWLFPHICSGNDGEVCAGYVPIGEAPTCFANSGGCGYDSLNVGVLNFPGAPYAGTDVNADEVFISTGSDSAPSSETGWTGYRPLGEITTQ